MKLRIVLLLLCTALCCLPAGAQAPAANYDESKVGAYTLPDPLVFEDGKPVRDAREWPRRRAEILRLFEDNVFGRGPAPRKARFEVTDAGTPALAGKAIRKQVTIHFSDRADSPKADLLIYLPAGAHARVPMILALNFPGNQGVADDPGVKLATVWDPKTHAKKQAPESSRGHDSEFQLDQILAHGYGLATVGYQDIEPDFDGAYADGIRALFARPGQTAPAPGEWGAIGAWSYGLSRAMDYLATDKNIDAKRVTLMGFSRLGKTALWAAAVDTRFALVLAACPGEGGASLARRDYGETIASMTQRYGYWFTPSLARFAGRVPDLPVDMHELIALLAPRPVYITGAEDDKWADPKGEFLAEVAAGPVYRLLGAQDLGTDEMPPLNRPIVRTLAFHIRDGKHAVTAFDWEQFLAFADQHLASGGAPPHKANGGR